MKNYMLTGVVALLLALLIPACQPEEPINVPFEETLELTELDRDPNLSKLLSDFTGQSLNGRTASTEMPFGTLDLSNITVRIANEDQEAPNYAIRLIPPDSVKHTSEYFIMIAESTGYRGYIMQYIADPDHLATLYDQSKFTGNLRLLNFNREVMADNKFIDGVDLGSTLSGGRSEGSNCSCEWVTEVQTVRHQVVVNGYSYWSYHTKSVTVLDCYCPRSFDGLDAGGLGGGRTYLPGQPVGDDPFGGSSGGGSGGGGNPGEPGGISDPDDIGVISDPCSIGVYNSTGICISNSQLETALRDELDAKYGPGNEDCKNQAIGKANQSLDETGPLLYFTVGVLEYFRCETSKDKATTPEEEFLYGFLNTMIDEFDATSLVDIDEAINDLVSTNLDCISENLNFHTILTNQPGDLFNLFMRCTFGLDITEDAVLLAYAEAHNYAEELFDDPYEQGQVTALVLSMFSPSKVLKAKKVSNLLKLAKVRKVKELLTEIRDLPNKSLPELKRLLKKHKLKDHTFDTQRDVFEDKQDIIVFENTTRKGNFGEIGTDVELTKAGYKLHPFQKRHRFLDGLAHRYW
ncbi:MAG: hypothetical protein AAFQ94_28895 [Bacteroidota bacterium]